MESRTFALGDCHGRFEALTDVLKKCSFDYEKDKLIVLGDIVDGGYNTYEVVEELLKIKHCTFVLGNHDVWFMDHMQSGWSGNIWQQQGGRATIKSYQKAINDKYPNYPVTHQDFFNKAVPYHIENNMVFVHGGFNPRIPMKCNSTQNLLWDRNLVETARTKNIYFNDVESTETVDKNKLWDKVFVGHTTTEMINGKTLPIKFNNLWCLDTGAGWSGKLTLMDVNTEEYWQSEIQEPCR
jgi:serine/threonine protein phosphatase 1